MTLHSADYVYEKIRRCDAESAGLLLRFAKKRYGAGVLQRGWEDYQFLDDTLVDMAGPDNDAFMRWFLFNWQPDIKETLAELLLAEEGETVSGDIRRFIETVGRTPYSFYQTLEVQPGEGLTLRDILRKNEVRVKERSASTILQRGYVILARVVPLDGLFFFMGTGSRVITPEFLENVLTLRKWLESLQSTAEEPISPETLLDHEEDLRETYFEIIDLMENRPLEIQNTDGDPIAFHRLTYEIPSFEVAFYALKDLEQKATHLSDTEMLEDAKKHKRGTPKELIIRWLRRGHKGEPSGSTTLATITISSSRLAVEVNSERRSKLVQREIRKRLGDEAVLLRTEIRSHEGLMKELAKGDSKPQSESDHDRLMKESPEARAFMKGFMEQHWAEWPDKPIPALRGMTPRQAAKDPEGRELLESLLMDFELQNERKTDEFLKVDIEKLRRELGMKARQK